MTMKTKIEIGDWLKIGSMALGLIVFGAVMKERQEAQASAIGRIEAKVDGLLVINANVSVLSTRLDDIGRRMQKLEDFAEMEHRK